MIRNSLFLSCMLSVLLPATAAEIMYVSDEFEVTMRSGISTDNIIVQMLRSGDPVRLLESDPVSKYSLVETEDGKTGYVLSRFLMDSPAARQQLTQMQERQQLQQTQLANQAGEISELNQQFQQEQADNEALKNALRASEQELSEVQEATQDTFNIIQQNEHLQAMVSQLREEKTVLSNNNAELSDSTRIDWFVRGAAVSLIAFVIGVLVTRIRWRKQDSWGS